LAAKRYYVSSHAHQPKVVKEWQFYCSVFNQVKAVATLITVIVKTLLNACNKPCHMSALESFLLAMYKGKDCPC